MTSASVPNPSLSSSLSSHHALNTNPIIPVEQPLPHLKTAPSDSSQPASAFGSTSVPSFTPALPFTPQRQSKPSNSPTQSQQGLASNSGASVHSSSSTAPALPPTDTVYTTQPMTKRRMLTPTFLPFTHIKVTNSHIRANDKNKEVISFSITVSVVIPPESDPEGKGAKASWVVEKLYSDVLSLDHTVKSKHSKVQNRSLAQLPDRALFKDHAPSKVDARKAVLQKYLHSLCAAHLTEKADVCDFFNSNIVINERNSTSTRPGFMQGYLTKKGRNFGGWQTRFYVLEGPTLEYFDTRGGVRLGHIAITGAQIGRQQYRSQEASDDSYRHAFLIRMHKREKEGEIDHILCAESDEERDAWVEALTCYVTGRYVSAEQAAAAAAAAATAAASSANSLDNPRRESPGPAALPSDARLGKRETSLDNSIRSESTQSQNLHHQPSSSYDQPVRLHRSQHHPKVESLGQMSSASDGGPIRSTASTIVEEHDSVESSASAMDSTSRTESGNRALVAYPEGREREQYTPRSPHLDVRASSYPHSVIPPGPSTPRPVASQPRLVSAQAHSSPQQDSLASDADSIVTTSADRPSTPETQQRPKISGPMNGAPITGGYRIKPPEEKKAKFRSAFWGFTGRNGVTDRNNQNALSWSTGAPFTPAPRPVFGVSLQEAVSVARVHEGLDLPAVVFRCVEFLEAKGAIEEEGIYRLSGSSVNIKSYKERFNTEGDFNLLESSKAEYHDVHAVAGLLKQFLRELASPILTRELHPEFLKVIDLSQRSDKVNELGRLCAELPLPNYTLLRFLSAHLIHIVQNEKVNKMSMRNVGIVFSPTLGMPAPLFALLLKEFDLVFNIEGDSRAPIRLPGKSTEPSALQGPSDGVPSNGGNSQKRMSRNSMLWVPLFFEMRPDYDF
ncbi:hypothetical protein CROQUDRAFT_53764 [Cronartium quercuum f. sp. fusiforme G11]|uniref:RhoGAP-domain-containing protein n=1 Tax=Cronartium quercuum f. sp. fusiforme G11 TaxID=708437 RepID=A0A9P6T759_9BASI|nr:hypothetical protein CROQUDRAFT_53764 [Cronartium quercuum f. sp. fusiforme G11]